MRLIEFDLESRTMMGERLHRSRSLQSEPLSVGHRDQVIGAMNLFLARPGELSAQDLALGQAGADIATFGLLQERDLHEQQLLAERHGLPTDTASTAIGAYARHTGQGLMTIATRVIDGSLATVNLALVGLRSASGGPSELPSQQSTRTGRSEPRAAATTGSSTVATFIATSQRRHV